jgi:hypothetical protein
MKTILKNVAMSKKKNYTVGCERCFPEWLLTYGTMSTPSDITVVVIASPTEQKCVDHLMKQGSTIFCKSSAS